MRKSMVILCVAAVGLGVGLLQAADTRNANTAAEGHPAAQNLEVVNSWTIYDDGNGTASGLVFPPGVATAGWQDHYLLISGGVVTASTIPFSIEEVQYYMENIWGSHASMGIWTPAGLSSAYFAGGFSGGAAGWNTVVLSTPMVITQTGFPQWWMGAVNSYTVGVPAPCATCRQVGIDSFSLGATGKGFYSDIDLLGFGVISPQPLSPFQIPIVRAGITATSNTVPVELIEFDIQ